MASDNETIRILTDMQKQLAVGQEREKAIKEDIAALSAELKSLKVEVGEIKAMANRWKGGFIVLAGIGGLVGWFLSSWQAVVNLFTRG